MYFLRLIRPLNLLIIAGTMYAMRWCIMVPTLDAFPGFAKTRLELQSSSLDFFLLVLSTLFIAAAGNIINDYFDLRADRINKPGQVIIGKYIKRRVAMGAHVFFNLLGILLAFYLAFKSRLWFLPLFHLFSAGSLWFYCVNFKKRLLFGNLIISLTTALVPILVAVYDLPLLARAYNNAWVSFFSDLRLIEDPARIGRLVMYWIMGYAGFAFIATLVREIQKDMADVEGDSAVGSSTLPITMGLSWTKKITASLIGLMIVIIMAVHFLFLRDLSALLYLGAGVCIPLLISLIITLRSRERRSFLLAATWLKLAMASAILFAYFASYVFSSNPLIHSL